MEQRESAADALETDWAESLRWRGVQRDYGAQDVIRLRGSLLIDYTVAYRGAERLWQLFQDQPFVSVLSALTGQQAMQQVKAGFRTVFLSNEQRLGDLNRFESGFPEPTQLGLNALSSVVQRVNKTLQRSDQLQWLAGKNPGDEGYINFMVPIIADAQAGQGGTLNAFELMMSLIEAGVSGVLFEDQVASLKHLGSSRDRVLVPTREAVNKLIAARLAADVAGVPVVLLARTDAEGAALLSSDVDASDHPYLTGERTREGYFRSRGGVEQSISRGLAYAPYADLLWYEAQTLQLDSARKFAEAVHRRFPHKPLAYHCDVPIQWHNDLSKRTMAKFRRELQAMGYKFQFMSGVGLPEYDPDFFAVGLEALSSRQSSFARFQQKQLLTPAASLVAAKPNPDCHVGYFDTVARIIESAQTRAVVETKVQQNQHFACSS